MTCLNTHLPAEERRHVMVQQSDASLSVAWLKKLKLWDVIVVEVLLN